MDCYHTKCPKCGSQQWGMGSSVYPMKIDYPTCSYCEYQTKEVDRKLDHARDGRAGYHYYVARIVEALSTIGEFYDDY
jgi:hypothetical protein